MESLEAYCSKGDVLLSERAEFSSKLRASIIASSGPEYLDKLAETARSQNHTDAIFTLYQPLFVEFVSRWSRPASTAFEENATNLSSLARVLPFAPYVKPHVREILTSDHFQRMLSTSAVAEVGSTDKNVLQNLLLALFRLLSYDRDYFDTLLHPIFFSSLLHHESLPVRYLAIECLCLVMHMADAFCEELVSTYVGNEAVIGRWESNEIDFRLLKLWEEQRWERLGKGIKAAQQYSGHGGISTRVLKPSNLSSRTALVGGVLLPTEAQKQTPQPLFVPTVTSSENLHGLGQALLEEKPVLIVGQAGTGKTQLISEAAKLLGKADSMVTLHLNEQTDAKSLIGLYTSSTTGGTFEWQAGVLTKAMQQGRWVLIEDIDKAPVEVLGVIRPIIETGDLFLTSRKERVRASDGFRIIATMKTSTKDRKTGLSRHSWLSNDQVWSMVHAKDLDRDEVSQIVGARFPGIQPLKMAIINAHEEVCLLYRDHSAFKAAQSRPPSLRDLLKWCRRVQKRVTHQKLQSETSLILENALLDIYMDALDCYAAYLNDGNLHNLVSACIAQNLNIPPQKMQHCLQGSKRGISDGPQGIVVGRTTLTKLPSRRKHTNSARLANTSSLRRTLDSVCAGIEFMEPYLLVGETGVGKTTMIQHVADLVGQTLTVVNLSQQSEATDLLGGLKPITTRSLVIPLVEQFNTLFDDTFSVSRNEKFQVALSKALARENWQRLLLLWQEAIAMAEKALATSKGLTSTNATSHPTKKRKVATPKYELLRERWNQFTSSANQIRAQVERGDKGHTFAFVEGRLIRALRNGEWLLLDEINLASSDTLDHIVGLLHDGDDEKPSILLVEAGNIEKIEAHPNFRIFAAMNPATDTGKKDLNSAVRSRFTELYVQSGDNDVHDLVKIAESCLGDVLNSDKRAAFDLANAYLELKRLNAQHRLSDGAGDVPHFSLRSLVRCLQYASQNHASHGLRRAIFEGFAMSFFTVLSRESEAISLPAMTAYLLSNVRNVKSFLAQQPKLSRDQSSYVAFRHHLVAKGPLDPDEQSHYIRTPSVERNLINLARATSMRRFPILLQGPTSAGKTSMVEFLAKFTGNKFVRVNNHEHTDLQEYLGSYASGSDGKLQYKEGVLVEALRQGHWIVLDELNLAPSDVLEALNRLLDDNRELLIPETQEVVRPHSNFMLFATQNPAGLYGGRKRLSRAFRNRFLELHFDDIPEDELELILRERAQIPPSFCTQIVSVYKKLSLQRQSTRLFEQRNSFATLRDLFRWASRPVDDRQALANHGFMLLAERVRDPAERAIVKRTIEETMKVVIDEDKLYNTSEIPSNAQAHPSIIWTSAMRRLFVLVSAALKNNEPVLLVGETGCGKTQVCQVIAEAFGRPLNIYNAHTNTETGDLIGSQRPVRSRAELVDNVIKEMQVLMSEDLDSEILSATNIDALIARFENTNHAVLDAVQVTKIKSAIGAYQSLFEWSDGSLVRSMKLGEHFLLDEISLADDSVLERLNSVLEPSRTILLAEKGPDDNFVVASGDFQFLATMNPGGDYGKRELSAALRNRMTEIWVPNLSQDKDVLPILQAKLGRELTCFADLMLKFATWFRAAVSSSGIATLQLRDLLAWINFIHKAPKLNPDVAFVHGAFLVFIDSLGANPAGMTAMVPSDIAAMRTQSLKLLQTLVEVDVQAIYSTIPRFEILEKSIEVGSFSMLRQYNTQEAIPDLVFDAPTTLRNTLRIVRAYQMGRAILLEGSPGVGKTAIISALAQATGKSLTRINLSDQTDVMDLFGTDAPSENEAMGRLAWKDGPLLQAMQTGGWVLLDEMNLASQSVLEGLNSCLDHRKEVYIAELDKSFTCHPDFFLFAAQNPHSQGGGRKGLPASFINRFTVVYADPFIKDDLLCICRRLAPEMPSETLHTVIQTVYDMDNLVSRNPIFSQGGPWELNLRDVNRWLSLCRSYSGMNPFYHLDTVVVQRFRNATQKSRARETSSSDGQSLPLESFYPRLNVNDLQVGISLLKRDAMKQYVHDNGLNIPVEYLPQAKAIMTALHQNWPVVLTGPPESGKRKLIRALAATTGAEIMEIHMNADTDTMDLLGGFEQFDPHRELMDFKQELSALGARRCQQSMLRRASQDYLASQFNIYQICQSQTSTISDIRDALNGAVINGQELQGSLEKADYLTSLFQHEQSRFIWKDGTLIDALERGAWVVLDNANLCNASVLDRLNSVLEPNGNLVVSEQHNAKGSGRVVKPHSNFRIFLTMDPRHGELSRAMRNRSLEIFLDVMDKDLDDISPVSYPASSRISNLRDACKAASENMVLIPFQDNLSYDDIKTLRGYAMGNSLDENALQSISLSIQDTRVVEDQLWQSISARLQSFPIPNRPLQVDASVLPQFSILNEPVYSGVERTPDYTTVKELANTWQILQSVSKITSELMNAEKRSQALPIHQRTMLERSIPMAQKVKKSGVVPPAFVFAKTICESVIDVVRPTLMDSKSTSQITGVQTVLEYVQDLLALFSSFQIDPAQLQAFLQVGRGVLTMLRRSDLNMAGAFSKAMQQFKAAAPLTTGQGLQSMWQLWKPITARSISQLNTKLALEELVKEFNNLSSMLPQSRRELAAIKANLLRASTTGWQLDNATKSLESLGNALVSLKDRIQKERPVHNHFEEVFDLILSRFSGSDSSDQLLEFSLLSLLCDSGDVSKDVLADEQTIFGHIQKLSLMRGKYDAHGYKLNRTLVTSLSRVNQHTLRSLDRTREELAELSNVICAKPQLVNANLLGDMIKSAQVMVCGLFYSHRHMLNQAATSCFADDQNVDFLRLSQLELTQIFILDSDEPSYLQAIYDQYLKSVINSLAQLGSPSTATTNEADTIRLVGVLLLNVSLMSLVLMVPDRAFDPALYPALIRDMHNTRIVDTSNKIQALQAFQKKISGQQSSLLIRIYERDLADLGQAPVVDAVARPDVSELDTLQQEFSNVLRNIVFLDFENVFLSEQSGVTEKSQAAFQLNHNIDRIVPRLRTLHRAYDDITQPVTHLLGCLGLGAELLVSAGEMKNAQMSASIKLGKHVPLLGGVPENVLNWRAGQVASSDKLSLQWLEHQALTRSVICFDSTSSQPIPSLQYLDILDKFYFEWKDKLSSDQVKAESNSRYYAYRGDDGNDDELDRREMAELFPDYEQVDQIETEVEVHKRSSSSTTLTVQLAKLHNNLFSTKEGPSGRLQRLVLGASSIIVADAKPQRAVPTLIDMLPYIMLQLEREITSLQEHNQPTAFNIYTDANISETQKLLRLVKTIRNRFFEIGESWPEHAVPAEVVLFTDELLEFKLDDPLAKLLTKTEKLLEIVGQWQSVASREWSVQGLMDELTGLVISWRRLELSSWSRLLDIEKQKHDESAMSWYFIAYEAVLVNPRRTVDQEADVPAYCQELGRTIHEFLGTATLGQYSPRLRLLETLNKTLAETSVHDVRLLPILTCVSNVVAHYRRYESNVEKTLQHGRGELEKALVEQIKLASWKDTNVTALRDSARRSHHKLFKIVRKFRSLLGNPVGVLKAVDVTSNAGSDEDRLVLRGIRMPEKELNSALTVCTESVPEWINRPERLRSTVGAAASMRRVYLQQENDLSAHFELASMQEELRTSIKELRSDTPATLTDDNASLVKHLRERKRKLFADTIKDITQMGIRRNLATSELLKQSSTADVLASSPYFSGNAMVSQVASADSLFHDLLDLLPQVRTALTEHSPDVTEGEIRRCIGLLEGMLHVTRKQRSDAARMIDSVNALGLQVSRLQSLYKVNDVVAMTCDYHQKDQHIAERICWLIEILALSRELCVIQGARGRVENATLISVIDIHIKELQDLRTSLLSFAELPNGLISQSQVEVQGAIQSKARAMSDVLESWCQKLPETEVILRQVIPWTEHLATKSAVHANGFTQTSLSKVEVATRTAANLTFVALQRLSSIKSTSFSTEDEGWLINNDKHLVASMQILHASEISQEIQNVLGQLHSLQEEELSIAISATIVMAPIFEQYYEICQHVLKKQILAHEETCKLSILLAKTFTSLSAEGFCSPSEKSEGQEQSGKLESGTGLGDGEGAEDISKDVGDDEDLSELAQSGEAQKNEGEIENAEDAVDMGVDELQGETGDNEEQKSCDEKEGDKSDEDGQDMDEETGSVDDLDPTAVDEKMWDDAKDELDQDKELKNEKAKGNKTEDQTAADGDQDLEQNETSDAEGEQQEQEGSEDDEAVDGEAKAEAENADPHLEQEKALELPEELQLTGEEEMNDDALSDGMDDLSDVEEPEDNDAAPEEVEKLLDYDQEENKAANTDDEGNDMDEQEENMSATAQDDEVMEDQPAEEEQTDEDLQIRQDDMQHNVDEDGSGETGHDNNMQDVIDSEEQADGQNKPETEATDRRNQGQEKASADQNQGESGEGTIERGTGREETIEHQQNEALRKLADVLDQWHQRREIFDPSENAQRPDSDRDLDMAEADFEHVDDEEDQGDTQALGAASADQMQNIDRNQAIQDAEMDRDDDTAPPDIQDVDESDKSEERLNRLQARIGAEKTDADSFVPDRGQRQDRTTHDHETDDDSIADEMVADVQQLDLSEQQVNSPLTSATDAAQLWHHCSNSTQQFSLLLTEQLRLILSPTTATKLRGDFRTGKRLNIKRIIPYIASGYKRDKIWMRRSIPSKRNYQIMIAVDDSRSMSESGADILAFETLAMLCKSLSMLEVGEICVVGFGEEPHVRIAHPFGQPFNNESGVGVFQNFSFRQKGTDVKKMVQESIQIFQDARLKSHGASDTWQLQLVISDGHCSDHEAIKRLVRKAQEERIIIVFVIVDASSGKAQGESIIDLKEAVFEPDPDNDGEIRVKTKRYLEGFPFPYYLVVRDVRDLPGVLATALKGWFGSVVDVK